MSRQVGTGDRQQPDGGHAARGETAVPFPSAPRWPCVMVDASLTGDAQPRMETVTIRELRNHGGEVVSRVGAGHGDPGRPAGR